jgi:transcriptional regulator with XRE-family HTH domain
MKKTLAERLDFLLSNLNIKQREAAERLGFTQSYLSMILNGGKKTPSSRFFEAAAREFSVNPEWLRSGKGEVYSVPGLSLSAPDAELVARYKMLPPPEQAIINQIIDALLVKSLGESGSRK